MRFAGIDIASETHVIAIVAEDSSIVLKPTVFAEDATGYHKVQEWLGSSDQMLIAMEATGHYWQNLFAALVSAGYAVALLNPLRTHRFAGEDLERTKTDAIDALGIARFAAQKRPPPTRLPEAATEELRELILVGASGLELRRKAIDEGMITLRQSGLRKVKEGMTTIEEVARVTAGDIA